MDSVMAHLISLCFPKEKLTPFPLTKGSLLLQSSFVGYSLGENWTLFVAKARLDWPSLYPLLGSLKALTPKPYVLYLDDLPRAGKETLMGLSQAFILRDGEIFIPNFKANVDLSKKEIPLKWTLASQAVYSFYLLAPYRFYSLGELQRVLGLSRANIGLQNQVLLGLGLLEQSGLHTGAKWARISDKRSYLEAGLSRLLDPRVQTLYLPKGTLKGTGQGVEASLSHWTNLNCGSEGYCLNEKDPRITSEILRMDQGAKLLDSTEVISLFAHGPYFMKEGYLNPFDVFACYHEDPDERVQAELAQLKEQILKS
jgi:hypothetical protein